MAEDSRKIISVLAALRHSRFIPGRDPSCLVGSVSQLSSRVCCGVTDLLPVCSIHQLSL